MQKRELNIRETRLVPQGKNRIKYISQKNGSFILWCWKRTLQILWTDRKRNPWVLKQIKPETLLEAKAHN